MTIGIVLTVQYLLAGYPHVGGEASQRQSAVVPEPVEAISPQPQADTREDDTNAFVGYVEDKGGTAAIDVALDPDSTEIAPVMKFMTSAEPFRDWVVPLQKDTRLMLGGDVMSSHAFYAYMHGQDTALVDVTSKGGRITSVNVRKQSH